VKTFLNAFGNFGALVHWCFGTFNGFGALLLLVALHCVLEELRGTKSLRRRCVIVQQM